MGKTVSLGGTYSVYTGYFWQISVYGHSEVIQSFPTFDRIMRVTSATYLVATWLVGIYS